MSTLPRSSWLWISAAFLFGVGAGILDLHAEEVQGPLLVLMASAFALAIARRAPPWAIGVAATLGLPAAHAAARLAGGGDGPSWGMLIALLPTVGAAYAGAAVAAILGRTADSIPYKRGDVSTTSAWYRRPIPSRALLLAAEATCAAAGAVPVYATLVARAQPVAWWVTIWWQLATFVGWAVLTPSLLALRKRIAGATVPGGEEPAITLAELAAHAALVVGGAAVHSLTLVALTRVLFVPLGPSTMASAMAWAFAAYLLVDALTYVLVLSLANASDADRRARATADRTATLSAQLDQSRLAALRAQLRPHFLFNALNAVVVLVRRGNASEAASVVTALADLLRYVLHDDAERELVELDAELAFVARYLEIEQARLGDRLRWTIEATEEARRALVPRLILQPLVENAVRHGIGRQIRPGTVRVHASHDERVLRLVVEDDGPGLEVDEGRRETGDRGGIGLANTRARLASLYRDGASLRLRSREAGGAIGEIIVPYAVAPAARSA